MSAEGCVVFIVGAVLIIAATEIWPRRSDARSRRRGGEGTDA